MVCSINDHLDFSRPDPENDNFNVTLNVPSWALGKLSKVIDIIPITFNILFSMSAIKESEMSYTSKKPCTISASDEFDCIEICGKYALFTDERLTPSDVPAGMHLYHLRQTDDGRDFATLEQTVFVNHGGSVLVREPIDLGKDGYIVLDDNSAPNFLGETMTIQDYLAGESPEYGFAMTMN